MRFPVNTCTNPVCSLDRAHSGPCAPPPKNRVRKSIRHHRYITSNSTSEYLDLGDLRELVDQTRDMKADSEVKISAWVNSAPHLIRIDISGQVDS